MVLVSGWIIGLLLAVIAILIIEVVKLRRRVHRLEHIIRKLEGVNENQRVTEDSDSGDVEGMG